MQEAASIHCAGKGQDIREMLEEADANLLVVIKDMRDGAASADKASDPGTVDLFSTSSASTKSTSGSCGKRCAKKTAW